jgi:DNA-directed RNA polymerase subunit K/omega
MNPHAIEQATDHDMASSFIAIRRAAKRARQVAAQTGTALIVQHGERIDRVIVTNQEILSKQTTG